MNDSDYTIFDLSRIGLDNISDYDDFLNSFPNTSYFHSANYLKAIIECRDVEPVAFLVKNQKDKIVGVAIGELADEHSYLPFITRRLIFYAPPLYLSTDVLSLLISQISQISAGLFIQIRYFYEMQPSIIELYTIAGFILEDHFNAYIMINDDISVYKKFQSDKRKGIRKAKENYGIIIQEYDDYLYSVNIFYSILKKLYRKKRHALRSKDYFYHLLSKSNCQVRIAFALYEGQPIATQLYIIHKNMISALYTAALSKHRNKHAGDLLIWYLIQTAHQKGMKIFDFGGGGKPDQPYPPREYKKRFGTLFENVGRLTLPKSFLFKFAMMFYKLIQK